MNKNYIIADGRWSGPHGIGRFSHEVLSRLNHADIFTDGPRPLSIKNIFWQPKQLHDFKNRYQVFFTPGFNPVLYSAIPVVFTIHDLIHLFLPHKGKLIKKFYYEYLMKPAVHRAEKIVTVSEYSKKSILEWVNIPEQKIIVAPNGVSAALTPQGEKHSPGYPYLLHVGNTKTHKNVGRLIEAFALAKIDKNIRLVLTGELTVELAALINQHRLENRVIFSKTLTDDDLIKYYRGALALVFPSLYEGFGLPVLEAMACGTPVMTSNITSLPEVAGDAAWLVDPYDLDSLQQGIEKISADQDLRKTLIQKGLERVKLFSWDNTANKIQTALQK